MSARANDPDPGFVEFNRAFINNARSADVSRFEHGNAVLPGTYSVDLYVNSALNSRQSITFREFDGSDDVQPCFTYGALVLMNVDVRKLNTAVVNAQNTCIRIGDISPLAHASMDAGALRFDVSIPQASLATTARGYVSPALWDAGQTAFLLSYNLNAYSLNQSFESPTASYGGNAISANGSVVPVSDGTYYAQSVGGQYTPSPNGGYMRTPSGTYVPVQPGSYTPNPSANANNYRNAGAYLGLNMGFNVGGWRLRSRETAVWDRQSGRTRWDNFDTNASHDLTAWNAQFTAGETYTQGVVFDSTSFRGITVYSDDRMRPDSQQGFAPVVRGVANTQARVQVHQHGNLIYESNVAPGPFVINDLYATGYGGDLEVTILEADGSARTFVMPYSAIPMLLRPRTRRWSLTQGWVRDASISMRGPFFVEGTYQQGMSNWLTLYGGVQATHESLYRSLLTGAAVNTPLGALGADVAWSQTRLQGLQNALSGSSIRMSFARSIASTDTYVTLSARRSLSEGYLSLNDAASAQAQRRAGEVDPAYGYRSKSRIGVTINQNFGGKYGALYLTGQRDSYWDNASDTTTYQLSYSNAWKRISYSVTASRALHSGMGYPETQFNNQIGLNLSIPFDNGSRSAPTLTAAAQYDDSEGSFARLGATGSFGRTNQYSYSASGNYNDTTGTGSSANGNLGWRAPYANLNAGYTQGNDYRQASVSASGGMVIHSGGVTLAPQLDLMSPIALIYAPFAEGASVSGGQTKIDNQGYAVAAGLIPYRFNDVTLDPKDTPLDVELQTTRLRTVPQVGAVVPLKFDTVRGHPILITAKLPDGTSLPFGAQALDAKGESVGVVGQGSQIFVRSDALELTLTVQWGASADALCDIRAVMGAQSSTEARTAPALANVRAVCQPRTGKL